MKTISMTALLFLATPSFATESAKPPACISVQQLKSPIIIRVGTIINGLCVLQNNNNGRYNRKLGQSDIMKNEKGKSGAVVWGNGATFDNVILGNAHNALDDAIFQAQA